MCSVWFKNLSTNTPEEWVCPETSEWTSKSVVILINELNPSGFVFFFLLQMNRSELNNRARPFETGQGGFRERRYFLVGGWCHSVCPRGGSPNSRPAHRTLPQTREYCVSSSCAEMCSSRVWNDWAASLPAGDWWPSADVAAQWHHHEVHGTEAGPGAQALPSHREAEAEQTVRDGGASWFSHWQPDKTYFIVQGQRAAWIRPNLQPSGGGGSFISVLFSWYLSNLQGASRRCTHAS